MLVVGLSSRCAHNFAVRANRRRRRRLTKSCIARLPRRASPAFLGAWHALTQARLKDAASTAFLAPSLRRCLQEGEPCARSKPDGRAIMTWPGGVGFDRLAHAARPFEALVAKAAVLVSKLNRFGSAGRFVLACPLHPEAQGRRI